MKNTSWKSIAELIGIAAIVASLIFVGLQLKQSHEIALAEQYQSRAEAAQEMYLSILESGIPWSSMSIPWEEKSEEQKDLAWTVTLWGWTQYDNHFFQYKSGFLDEESWNGLSRRISQLYDVCEMRPGWVSIRPFLRSSFVEYVDSLDDECSDED